MKEIQKNQEQMMQDLVDKRKIVTSVAEICDLWPESHSRAFYLNNNKEHLYFMVKKPEYIRTTKILSIMTCFKVVKGAPVVLTELTIYHTDILYPITLFEYKEKVKEIFNGYLNKTEHTQEDISIIQSFETSLGFKM